MDLGCLDTGCISVSDSKLTTESVLDSENKEHVASESLTATSKIGKNKQMKENGQSTLNSLNKSTSQIKKPNYRKNSPINWFPRKKVDSYLNRKIKMLQEVAGMNLTLDETLGDSSPHYSKVLREKIAARETANNAIEARKAALVEASWCRILKAARIQSKEAEAQLLKAEKTAAEAFDAALAIGVNMYDIPNCPKNPSQVDTYPSSSSSSREKSTTHAVTASFETAFDVDKEVAAAVKTALIQLANCPSFKKDEFKNLLRKISQNPDTSENDDEEQYEDSSPKCESKSGSESKAVSRKGSSSPQDSDCKNPVWQRRQRKSKRRQSLERLNKIKLVNMMFDRLQLLQEDELSSLATIVATCGLNVALAEIESNKPGPAGDYKTCNTCTESQRRLSCWGTGKKQTEPELPSLDKFLVKHMTKLEREALEARNRRKESSKQGIAENSVGTSDKSENSTKTIPDLGSIFLKHSSKFEKEIEEGKKKSVVDSKMGNNSLQGDTIPSDAIPDLGSVLIKNSSKLEKEFEEARKNYGNKLEGALISSYRRVKEDGSELPSLDKFLVKHVSRLEKQVQEAKDRNKVDSSASVTQEERNSSSHSDEGLKGKENADLNMRAETNDSRYDSLDKILVKPVHRLQREKMQALALGNDSRYDILQKKHSGNVGMEYESLDKVLVKHVSRLEREKMRAGLEEEAAIKVKKDVPKIRPQLEEAGGLDQVLVKHKSRLEREKLAAAQQPEDRARVSVTRREARERELQEAWGGLSLGNSMKPHLSKLERDKAAWIKAEEEERKQGMVLSD